MIVLRMTAVTIAVLLLVGCGGGGSSRTAPLMDSTIGETQDSTTVDTGTDSVSTGELRTIWAGAPLPSSADELAPVSVAYDQVLSYGAWSNVQAGAFGGFLQYVPADLSRASDLPSVGRAVYDGRHASYVQRGGVHSAVSGDASISILFGTGFNSDDMFVTVQLWDGTRSRFDRDVFLTLHNTNPVRVAPTFAVAVGCTSAELAASDCWWYWARRSVSRAQRGRDRPGL